MAVFHGVQLVQPMYLNRRDANHITAILKYKLSKLAVGQLRREGIGLEVVVAHHPLHTLEAVDRTAMSVAHTQASEPTL